MTDETHTRPVKASGLKGVMQTFELDTRMLAMIAILLAIWLGFNFFTDSIFLTPRNLYNLAVQSSVVGIMATGMVLVIVARHIDLSVGSILGFTGMAIAWLQVDIFPISAGWNWPLTIVIGLALGAFIGAIQGFWVANIGIPAFVVTLGGLLIFRGGAFLVTDGRTVAPMNATYQNLGGGIHGSIGAEWSIILGFVAAIAIAYMMYRDHQSRKAHNFPTKPIYAQVITFAVWAGLIALFVAVMNSYTKPRSDIARGIPIPVLILIATVVIMSFITKATRFGRYVFAMGGNPEAAELSGINVKKVTVIIFAIMGILCAVGAIITSARLNAATNSMGVLLELSVIAAAVIGGTSLAGGAGSIAGAILGAVIMQSLENGLVLLGAGSAERQITIGLVLILAVTADKIYNYMKMRG